MIVLNEVYTLLKERLKALSTVKKVDWYNEQYQNTEEERQIRYPAVYVEFLDPIPWVQNGDKFQHAKVTIRLHSVIYDIQDSPIRSLEQAQLLFEQVNSKSLYASDGFQYTTELVRTSTSMPKRYDQLKVILMEFTCEIFDISCMPKVDSVDNVGFVIS